MTLESICQCIPKLAIIATRLCVWLAGAGERVSRGDRRAGTDARDGGGGLFDVARLGLCHGRDIGRVRRELACGSQTIGQQA